MPKSKDAPAAETDDAQGAAVEAAAAESAEPQAYKPQGKVEVLSKGKTVQVVSDGFRVWKEPTK